jgi:hypothetical protein
VSNGHDFGVSRLFRGSASQDVRFLVASASQAEHHVPDVPRHTLPRACTGVACPRYRARILVPRIRKASSVVQMAPIGWTSSGLNEGYTDTIMNESTDVSGNRIINISFVTRSGSFYVGAEACGANSQSAEYLAAWYKAKVTNVLGPEQWWRVSSLAIDTCNTMRAVWRVL